MVLLRSRPVTTSCRLKIDTLRTQNGRNKIKKNGAADMKLKLMLLMLVALFVGAGVAAGVVVFNPVTAVADPR